MITIQWLCNFEFCMPWDNILNLKIAQIQWFYQNTHLTPDLLYVYSTVQVTTWPTALLQCEPAVCLVSSAPCNVNCSVHIPNQTFNCTMLYENEICTIQQSAYSMFIITCTVQYSTGNYQQTFFLFYQLHIGAQYFGYVSK